MDEKNAQAAINNQIEQYCAIIGSFWCQQLLPISTSIF
jgi:hypothetical protein